MLFVCASKLLHSTLQEVSSEREQLELEKDNMSEQLMEKVECCEAQLTKHSYVMMM